MSSSAGYTRWILRMLDHGQYLGTRNYGIEEETRIYLQCNEYECGTRISGGYNGKFGMVIGSIGGCLFIDPRIADISSMALDYLHYRLVTAMGPI